MRTVRGHSMVPVLPPGTRIWASRWYRKLSPGDVVVIMHEGKEKIKRIAEIKDDELYVVGDHPESSTDSRHYGWLPIASVIGRVIWPDTGKS